MNSRPPGRRPREWDLLTLVGLLPALALLPLAIFAAALMYLLAEKGTAAARESLERADQAAKEVVRSELEQATIDLRQLATASESLDISLTKRLASTMVGPDQMFNAVLLASPQLDTALAGHPVPRVRATSLPPPGVTDLRSVGEPRQGAVEVVFSRPEGAVVLVGQLNLQRLSNLLAKYAGQNNVSSVLDANKLIIARSEKDFSAFFGMHPSEQTLQALARAPTGGAERFKTRDGRELFWTWTTLDKPRWTVFLGTPTEGLDEVFHRSMFQLLCGAVIALGLGVFAAGLVGRRILRATDDLTQQAPGLVSGETRKFRRSGLRQIDALYRAMSDAGTELNKAQRERDEALAAERVARELAERHNRAKDVFLATLSHELRNPLAPIVTASAVLQLPSATTNQRDKAAQVIGRQASTLSQLLDDLLEVSRITTGRILLNLQDVRVAEVIDEAVETVRPLLEERQHRLTVNVANLVTRGDRLRLIQVVTNLLNNAAKYTDAGGGITVQATAEGKERLLISVTDNGIGIPPDALGRVFEIFAQLEEQRERSRGGLGIGLSLVKGIVELHGGTVAVFSEGLGKGTHFEVRLPRTETSESAYAVEPTELGAESGRHCVMVVDDNVDAADTMKLLLEASGQFDVEVKHSAEAALQAAAKKRHDAICLDIGLPDMSGYELARRIKRVSSAKLIATTGWGSQDHKRQAFEAGFDAHLTKPVDPEQLMGQLHLLSGRQ